VEHVLAGSDYPHQIGSLELMKESITQLPISEADKDKIRAGNTARILGMRPTTLSNHLRRLGDRGLVRRRPDPHDGRAALIQLTAKGRRDTEACFPAFADAIGLFRKGLAEEGVDEEQVLVVLEAVARALGAAVRAP